MLAVIGGIAPPVAEMQAMRESVSYLETLVEANRRQTASALVEQKSRADFAPDTELPLSKLTATDNIMLGNQDWKSSFAMLSDT